MARYQKVKKRRTDLENTRKALLVIRNCPKLELLIKDKSGKCTTYYVPFKVTVINRRLAGVKKSASPQVVRVQNAWEIVGNTANLVAPESLVNKKICLRKGNKSVEGIVLKATAHGKAPGGMPVPVPPPPIDREDFMH